MSTKDSSFLGRLTSDFEVNDLLFRTSVYLVIAFIVSMSIIPLLYVISVSFRAPSELFTSPHLIPKTFTFEMWTEAISELRGPLKSSVIIATGTAIIALLITIPGAYVFGRKEFPGKEMFFYIIVISLMFPYVILIIPISATWLELGLYNTIPGLWLGYQIFVAPFAIWILRDFFAKLPKNLEEAAQVYGCSQFSAFVRVILPISAPAVMAVGFLAFLTGWNDFMFSYMLTTSIGPQPAIVHLFKSISAGERILWGLMMAEAIIIGTPPTILYLISRRYLTNAFAVD